MEVKNTINLVIVDDSEFSRKTLQTLLESEGYRIQGIAAHPQEAKKLITSETTILISDIVMPGKNGIEFAQEILQDFPKLGILMMSSLDQDHIVMQSIAAGAMDFLKKPFQKQELLESLSNIYEYLQKK